MARCNNKPTLLLLLQLHQLRLPLVLLLLLPLLPPPARAQTTYDVSASGDGGYGLSAAMALAEPGDTISLADGTYDSAVVSVRDGEAGSPITVVGGPGAIINGEDSSRSVEITHSFITLKGFSIQGKIGSSNTTGDYVDKCVYVGGPGMNSSSPLDGFVMEGLFMENCGGECVRLKNYVVNANITGNTIENCGIHDYAFASTAKNGEGIYIGTSSNQWADAQGDSCDNNVVRGNHISTNANECVDIKEGSTGNIVEDNFCSNQLDEDSGCYDSRGDGNIFRHNVGSHCVGAGVRLGGWEVDGHQFGVLNSVYGNDFSDVGNGAIKVVVSEQGDICGNTCEDGYCGLTGNVQSDALETWNEACSEVGGPSTSDGGDGGDDGDGDEGSESSDVGEGDEGSDGSNVSSGSDQSGNDENDGGSASTLSEEEFEGSHDDEHNDASLFTQSGDSSDGSDEDQDESDGTTSTQSSETAEDSSNDEEDADSSVEGDDEEDGDRRRRLRGSRGARG